MLMRNTEVGKEAHRALATPASISMHAELRDPVLENRLPEIMTVALQCARIAIREGTTAGPGRPQIAPMLDIILHITAERNILFAWLRGGLDLSFLMKTISNTPRSLI